MKKENSLKIALSILIIVLITLVSIGGIYVKDKNIMKNILPDYEYGMEFDDINIIKLKVKEEEKTNENSEKDKETSEDIEKEETDEGSSNDEKQNETSNENQEEEKNTINTKENFLKTKNIIEKRLKMAGVEQYIVRLDEQSGDIVVELPTNVMAGVAQNVLSVGKFEIKIEDNNEVIATNKNIKKVETSIDDSYAIYGEGSIVKMNIVFDKETTQKFEEIKNTYEMSIVKESTTSEEDSEDTEEDEDEPAVTIREVGLYIDGSSLCSQNMKLEEFLQTAINGNLPLTIGGFTTDEKSLETSLKQANLNKSIIQNEEWPIEYKVSYSTNAHSNVNKKVIIILFAIVIAIMLVYLVIKYKTKGILGMLSIIGLLSTILLEIRFSNLMITISTLLSAMAITVLQFIFICKYLNKKQSTKSFNESIIEITKMLIPVSIMSLIIAFASTIELSYIGQLIFLGLIAFEVFNNIITRAMLSNKNDK